ncbi:hypothetical protein RIF29_26595 [Crotalaria pallida]|uniref:Uncharacterized protein n=1 Tax=Crotalaria pallida TaxID=3830 RepID=A0AAN9HY70_CROPI
MNSAAINGEELAVVTVAKNTVVNTPPTGIVTEREENSDSAGKVLIAAEKETLDTQSKTNPFGPWMLVKRPARKKERLGQKQNGSSMLGGNKGIQRAFVKGKFDALIYEEEDNSAAGHDDTMMNVHDSIQGSVNDLQRENHVMGHPKRANTSTHKEVRTRSALAGKNPQQHRGNKEWALGSVKPQRSMTKNKTVTEDSKCIVEAPLANDGQHESKQYKGSKEYKEAMKAKEREALHLMKIYEKSKGLVLPDFAIQTYLPEKEAINFAHQFASSSKNLNPPPEPPDGKHSSGSGMDIDFNNAMQFLSANDVDVLIPDETGSLNQNINL